MTLLRTLLIAGLLAHPLKGLADPPPVAVEEEVQAAVPENHVGYTSQPEFSYRSKAGDERKRRLFLWYPTEVPAKPVDYGRQKSLLAMEAPVKAGPWPLIVFSHGFWGSADQSLFLMEALARAGYVVASVDHLDSVRNQEDSPVRMPNFIDAKSWEDDRFLDRKEDMTALLDHLLELDETEGSVLHGRLKREAVGAAGHSLGGYTVLGLAGARKTWKDDRIKAALLLSPYTLPYNHHGDLGAVSIPVMLQGGTLDVAVTPFLGRVYGRLAAPKYYLILRGESHYGWTNFVSFGKSTTDCLKEGNPKLIADYSIAFFDQNILGLDRKKVLADRGKGLFSYRVKQ